MHKMWKGLLLGQMFDLEKYYRVYAGINLDCIYANMESLKNNVKNDTQMVAVVKADGYGHGAIPVACTVDELVEAYAVATIEEALQLRHHGIVKPIYLLGFISDNRIDDAIKEDIRFAVFKTGQAEKISKRAKELGRTAFIHIKLDTGMGRIGFLPDEAALNEVLKIGRLPNVNVEGIFTHFAKADESDKSSAHRQLSIYTDFIKKLKENGMDIKIKHCSNSAGIIDMPEANMSEVRAGIALYGMYPSDEINKKAVTMYPAMEIKSHIIYLKTVEKGTSIGYGGTFTTSRTTKVATIPVGYGDGYPRSLSNKGSVLIRGRRAAIIGRVCMDQIMVDVTDICDVEDGDEVTLIGRDGDDAISVEEAAGLAGTFNYEFVCNIGKRIPRVYYRNGKVVCTKDYFDDEYTMNLRH